VASLDEIAVLGGSSLLHSDIQPENLLVGEYAVLVDWTARGLARSSST
jgi:thiamine kinase-like enzyme